MNGLHALRLGSLSLRWRPRAALACLVLAGVGLALAAALLGTGSLALGPAEVFASLLGQGQDPTAQRIVQRVRLPRVLTACLVGAALGMAGAIFQSISRNPLGSPDVIGFTTGAASGAIVQIILFDAGPLATSLAALAAGLCTALAVVLLARRGATAGGYRLVLVGIGVGASLSGLNSLLLVTGNLDQAMYAQLWLAGSLNTRTWSHVVPAALGLLASVPLALYHGRRLEVLELGDASAAQLGVAVERVRLQMVLVVRRIDGRGPAAGRRPARPAPGIRRQPADRPDDRPARRFLPALATAAQPPDLSPGLNDRPGCRRRRHRSPGR